MKQNIGPIAIGIAALVVIGLVVVLWRVFLPPSQDFSTPTKVPSQVQKNREMIERFRAGDRSGGPGGMPNGAPGGGMPNGAPGAKPGG